MTPSTILPPATDKAKLLAALKRNGIEATPRTLATWMETADNLCKALADYYRETEPQALHTLNSIEETAGEFRLLDV
jgi:hypothetical protein